MGQGIRQRRTTSKPEMSVSVKIKSAKSIRNRNFALQSFSRLIALFVNSTDSSNCWEANLD